MTSFTIDRRFRGPEDSGNGGYSCGMVARFATGDTEVTLRRPPPLDRPLTVQPDGTRVLVLAGEDLVAEAESAEWDLAVPEAPTLAEAEAAARRFAGFERHAFTTCFVCGTARDPGDGLRIFAGPVPGRDLVACPFTPGASLPVEDGMLATEMVWSLLDCPGAWAVDRHAEHNPVVLGRMAARVVRRVPAGGTYLATGWAIGRDGRKLFSGTALFAADGTLHGYARQTWIVIAA